MKTTFNPPGLPMAALAQIDTAHEILIAGNTEVYASGPSTPIGTGWYEPADKAMGDKARVKVSWNHNSMPLDNFQCWWPLPKVTHSKT